MSLAKSVRRPSCRSPRVWLRPNAWRACGGARWRSSHHCARRRSDRRRGGNPEWGRRARSGLLAATFGGPPGGRTPDTLIKSGESVVPGEADRCVIVLHGPGFWILLVRHGTRSRRVVAKRLVSKLSAHLDPMHVTLMSSLDAHHDSSFSLSAHSAQADRPFRAKPNSDSAPSRTPRSEATRLLF